MGLSASQARLLTLTTRLSDLELKAQSISNSKMRLADASTEASRKYQNALNKEQLNVYSGVNADGTPIYQEATAANLTTYDSQQKQRFLKDASGNLIVSDTIATAYSYSGNNNLEGFLNELGLSSYATSAERLSAASLTATREINADINNALKCFDSAKAKSIQNAAMAKASALTKLNNISSIDDVSKTSPLILNNLNTILSNLGNHSAIRSTTNAAITYGTTHKAGQAYSNQDIMDALDTVASGKYASTMDEPDPVEIVTNKEWELPTFTYTGAPAPIFVGGGAGTVNVGDSESDVRVGELEDGRTIVSWNDPVRWDPNSSTYVGGSSGGAIEGQNVADAVNSVVNTTCTDLGNALLLILGENYSMDAYVQASNTVKDFYRTQVIQNDTTRSSESAASDLSSGTTLLVKEEAGAGDDWWIDKNQLIKTFLNYYDAACSATASKKDDTTTLTAAQSIANIGFGSIINSGSKVTTRDSGLTVADYKAQMRALIEAIDIEAVEDATVIDDYTVSNPSMLAQKLDEIADDLAALMDQFNISAYVQSLGLGNLSTSTPNLYNILKNISITDLQQAIADATFVDTTQEYDTNSAKVAYYTNLYNEIQASNGINEQSDDILNDPDWLYDQLNSGNVYLETQNNEGEFERISWSSGDITLTTEMDDNDIARAEAEYEAVMSEIKTKDQRFDLQLKSIDTEHEAIKNQVDSVQKVITKNIDRTFKIFDA